LAENLRADGRRVIAAVNGGFFMRSAQCYLPWGMQIVDGKVISEPRTGKVTYKDSKGVEQTINSANYSNWFGITTDGKPVIGDLQDYNNTYKGKDLLKFGICGKQFIMRNGKYIPNTASTETSDAKTAIGYNAKGDIVIVSISGNDNDLTKHPGATLADVAQVFMDLDVDVTNILNLDGGGSTTMVFENSNYEIVRGSVQYGTTDNSVERPVSDIVAVVLN
jgi:exopolysaccharide biosynthesis protein